MAKNKRRKVKTVQESQLIPTKIVVVPRFGTETAKYHKSKTFFVDLSNPDLRSAYVMALGAALEYQETIGKENTFILKKGMRSTRTIKCY